MLKSMLHVNIYCCQNRCPAFNVQLIFGERKVRYYMNEKTGLPIADTSTQYELDASKTDRTTKK